uniref:Uncharacterized protein n=1 Tax=Peronospora matthiolae TaxID=2874970 RepID=A0AAV1UH05_9STRA
MDGVQWCDKSFLGNDLRWSSVDGRGGQLLVCGGEFAGCLKAVRPRRA